MCVGPLDRDPGFVDDLRRRARSEGLDDRLCFTGARTGEELDRAYGNADVLVLASHAETYGMVVTEALARGLPVVATAVGGVPEALGCADDGRRPGLLVPAGDPRALTHALGQWLRDGELRQRLRDTARNRRTKLTGWPTTSDQIAHVLGEVAA
jgi:glycosyltransferase involved in cell wall biosynthesis